MLSKAMNHSLFRFLLVIILWSQAVWIVAQSTNPMPNIILIVADDMGYNDIGCFGASRISTPNLDTLASNGIRFTDFYVSQAVCSASRASILTGCYANRVGILGALTPHSRIGINPEETTIAEMLKERGYHTGMIGKWHLGDRKEFLPKRHGFDSYFGVPYSNDMWPNHPDKLHFPPLPVYQNNRIWTTLEDQSQLTTWYTERALKFIQTHASKPFFLYIAHSMPHVPLFVSDKFKGKSDQGLYGDVIMEIDWSVGEIINTLREEGLVDHTLVIFTSDNGPWLSYGTHGGSAFPLREGKGTAWDGGQRVPCIMYWPGLIPEGGICEEPVMTIDLLPSLAEITGAKLPEKEIDGKSILPLMIASPMASSPHDYLAFYYGRKLNSVRSGKWKMHLPHGYRTLNGREGRDDGIPIPYEQAFTSWALYDMEHDVSETENVMERYPEVAEELKTYADKMIDELGDAGVTGSESRTPGYIKGYVVEKGVTENLASGVEVILSVPITNYTQGGANALIDGVTGTMRFNDGAWLGINGKNLEGDVCLDRKAIVSEIAVRFLVDQRSWIFEPREVKIAVSMDGLEFQELKVKKKNVARKMEPAIVSYSAKVKQDVRCIRVVGENIRVCPTGHPGEGKNAWIFVDEIIVK